MNNQTTYRQMHKNMNCPICGKPLIESWFYDEVVCQDANCRFNDNVFEEIINKKMNEEINKSLNMVSFDKYTNKPFTEEQLNELLQTIKDIPPIVTELQVYMEGYKVIYDNVSVLDDFRENELKNRTVVSDKISYPLYNGIKIVVIEYDDELKTNQAKAIYSDGYYEIINIWEE